MIETSIQLHRIKGLTLPPSLTPQELSGVAQDSALSVAASIRKNFRALATKSKSRHFWRGALDSTEVGKTATNGVATITVSQVGVRLHWKGGTVRPTGRISDVTGKPTRALLIPFDDSPLRKRRQSLKELGYSSEQIHVLKSKKGTPILVAAQEQKKKTKLIWLGKLVKQAHHEPRPEVMPDNKTLSAALQKGAVQSVKHLLAKHANSKPQ